MSASAILFAGSNTTGSGRLFVETARQLDLQPVLLSDRVDDYGLFDIGGLRIVRVDPLDLAAATDAARRIGRECPIAGVLTSSERCAAASAALAQTLGLPGPCPESVRLCRDKRHQRRVFDAAGVPSPRWRAATSLADARRATREFGLPVCVKPASASGSMGVRVVRSEDELEAAVREAIDRSEADGAIVVEELLIGPEYSVELFDLQVVGVTTTEFGGAAGTLERAHRFPAPLSTEESRWLGDVAIDALKALGLGFGPAHVEMRRTQHGPRLIEVNPRLAGGMIPELVRRAHGVDLVRATLERAIGRRPRLERRKARSAAIAFALAEAAGTVAPADPRLVDEGVDVALMLPSGTRIEPRGDFRDRFAYAIACDPCGDAALARAEEAARAFADAAFEPDHSTGLLRRPLDPEIRALVFGERIGPEHVPYLSRLAEIDRAHLVMQVERGVVESGAAGALLAELRDLEKAGFEPLLGAEPVRGVYLAYERCVTERVGPEAAQALHVGRSRNDIHATEHRMALRERLGQVIRRCHDLIGALLQRNQEHGDALMPVYTQHLVAAPGTLGHWLLACATALTRDTRGLDAALIALRHCPLGAVAAAGTDLPIDTDRTARLLGFTGSSPNALDAVASRDAGLRTSAAAAVLAVTLGRVAADLQTWARPEIGLIRFPDELVGSSSVLPQKRNHFLLEHVQSGASSSLGAFVAACIAQQATPFTNAVAVATESTRHLPGALDDLERVLILAQASVTGFEPREDTMRAAAGEDAALAPLAAELLRRHAGLSPREAHREVGRLLRGKRGRSSLAALVCDWAPAHGCSADDLRLEELRAESAHGANGGGGPGRRSRASQALRLEEELSELRARQERREQRARSARAELDRCVRSLTEGAPCSIPSPDPR